MGRRNWKLSELRAIDDALDAGSYPAEIGRNLAVLFGRTVSAVAFTARQRHRARLSPEDRQTARPWTEAEIRAVDKVLEFEVPCRAVAIPMAKRMHRSVNTVLRVLHERRTLAGGPKAKRPWTEAECEKMRQMRAEGETWAAIASHLGRPASAARYKAGVLGLTERRA